MAAPPEAPRRWLRLLTATVLDGPSAEAGFCSRDATVPDGIRYPATEHCAGRSPCCPPDGGRLLAGERADKMADRTASTNTFAFDAGLNAKNAQRAGHVGEVAPIHMVLA